MLHRGKTFSIYFGTAQDQLYPAQYLALPAQTKLLQHPLFAPLQQKMALNSLTFLRQTHSTQGYRLEEQEIAPTFAQEGDYLITSTSGSGLGIMTADCLPIIMIDHKNHRLAAIHAGWRGSVAGIAVKAMKQLTDNPTDLEIFFGPSARACCYQVDAPFLDNIPEFFKDKTIFQHNGTYYFDLPLFNALLLQQAGITQPINTSYNFCTMCDHRFFSHRRQAGAAGRQMTVGVLL